jgi:hypothetical protein
MYRWKAWHDARRRLALYAAACLILGTLAGTHALAEYRQASANIYVTKWKGAVRVFFPRSPTPDPARLSWLVTHLMLTAATMVGAAWAGVTLASHSAGKEYGEGTMHFLLTRPQRRRALAWTDWSLGASGAAIVVLCLVGAAYPFFSHVTASALRPVPSPLRMVPGALLLGLVAYGLSQLLTTLTGSSFKGMNLSVIVAAVYGALPEMLTKWWHWDVPVQARDWTLAVFRWGRGLESFLPRGEPHLAFPAGPAVFWLLVIASLMALTQWTFARRQV